MIDERKLTIRYSVLQGIYWMLAAVAMGYVTPLLEAKGFGNVQIGLLNAVKYASVVIFQVMIASFLDKYARTIPLKYFVAVLTTISIVAAYIFWISEADFIEAVILFVIFGATINCISPLIDSLAIQYMNHGQKVNYTCSRACGSASWAVFFVITGAFSDYFGAKNILLLQIALAILFVIAALTMEKVDFPIKKEEQPKTGNQKENVHNTWYLLTKYPKYLLFLIACMLIFMGYNLNATFLIDVIKNLGGNHTDYGISGFVLAMSEIPMALVFMHLKKYWSVDKLMVWCAVFCTLRAAATTFAPSVHLLIAAQGLEFLGLGIFYAGSVFFVMDNLPMEDAVKGVALINVATVGVGEAVASALCGLMKEVFGLHSLMLISVVVSFFGILVMILMVNTRKGE